MFHILWLPVVKCLYMNFLIASIFIKSLSDCIATYVSTQVLSFLFLIITSN
jgi:hypothetical protein